MPSNLLSFDSNFPSFTGEETPEQQIRALHNYLFQLREGLQYSLRNLTVDNFNATALQNLNEAQKSEVATQLEKVYALLNQITAEVASLSGRVSSAENLSGRMGVAEREISDLKGRTKLTEENVEALADRVKELENDQTLAKLQEAINGEGGIQEQMDKAEQALEKLSDVIQVAEDGSVTLGLEEKQLHLVGQVYINGVLYGQGGTA